MCAQGMPTTQQNQTVQEKSEEESRIAMRNNEENTES